MMVAHLSVAWGPGVVVEETEAFFFLSMSGLDDG